METNGLNDRMLWEGGRFMFDEDVDRAGKEEELLERLQQALGKTRIQVRRLTNHSLSLSDQEDRRDDP